MLLRFFSQLYPAMGANSTSQFFGSSFFWKLGLSYESLEPLIGFLTYLEPRLWPQNQKLVKRYRSTNVEPGYITPILDMTITRQQLELESCSGPL